MIKVKLLRPLDGRSIGDTPSYPEEDAARLKEMGCVEIIGKVEAPTENKMQPAPENKDVRRVAKKSN